MQIGRGARETNVEDVELESAVVWYLSIWYVVLLYRSFLVLYLYAGAAKIKLIGILLKINEKINN